MTITPLFIFGLNTCDSCSLEGLNIEICFQNGHQLTVLSVAPVMMVNGCYEVLCSILLPCDYQMIISIVCGYMMHIIHLLFGSIVDIVAVLLCDDSYCLR